MNKSELHGGMWVLWGSPGASSTGQQKTHLFYISPIENKKQKPLHNCFFFFFYSYFRMFFFK